MANDHYVPQFILRQFLADESKEQVEVYDKQSNRTFKTRIRNVMAEQKFHQFKFSDHSVSFEPIATRIEHEVLPAYEDILKTRRLDGTPEQKAKLSLLVAFQFLRTKAHRERWHELEAMLVAKVESAGGRMQDVRGWEDWTPMDEDRLKKEHLESVLDSLGDFAKIICTKDFLLAEPSRGRSFYLGDNPVCLHNQKTFGPYGNIGLSVTGIEMYMPLAHDLMLCMWCPSLLRELRADGRVAKDASRSELVGKMLRSEISTAEMKRRISLLEEQEKLSESIFRAAAEGHPLDSQPPNMDYYNSLQVTFATRYLVCRKADFEIARKASADPDVRKGGGVRLGHN